MNITVIEPLFVPIVSKREQVVYKVFDRESFERLLTLFQSLQGELHTRHPTGYQDTLYEIRKGPKTYSGPSFSDFKAQYELDYAADAIRLVTAVRESKANIPGQPSVVAHVAVTFEKTGGMYEIRGIEDSWVLGVFERFESLLRTVPSRHRWLYNPYVERAVEIVALLVIAMVAIAIANIASGHIDMKYSEVYAFVIAYLVLTGIWQSLAQVLIALRNSFYPKLDMRREPRTRLIVGGLLVVLTAAAKWAVDHGLDLLTKQH